MLKNRGFLYPLQEFYQPLHNIQFMDQVEYLYDLNLDDHMIMDVFLVFPGKNLTIPNFFEDWFKIQLGVN